MSLDKINRAAWCLRCLGRSLDTPSIFSPVSIQVRGKKKLPRRTTITIRLLQDVRAYGRKGTILAIAPARMRNHLYPRAQAAYMTVAEIKQAQADELVMERDASFGLVNEVHQLIGQKPEIKYDMRVVTPQRAHDLLETIIPDTIIFERKAIPNDSISSADVTNLIFGSVSSLDILMDLTSRLAEKAGDSGFEDATRVVMSAQDIQIKTEGLQNSVADVDRIKALGDFDITINIKGNEPIARRIKVVPTEAELQE